MSEATQGQRLATGVHEVRSRAPFKVWTPAVLVSAAWLAFALWLHDPFYDEMAVLCSAFELLAVILFALWTPGERWREFRILALFNLTTTFLTTGFSVLQEVRLEEMPYPASVESYSAAVESAMLYSVAMIAGTWVAMPRIPKAIMQSERPMGVSLWVVAATSAAPGLMVLVSRSGAGLGTLGTLPGIVFNSAVVLPMVIASRHRLEGLLLGAILVGNALVTIYNSAIGAMTGVFIIIVLGSLYVRRPLPWKLGIAVLLGVAILNPAKHVFRRNIVEQSETRTAATLQEGVSLWIDAISETWSNSSEDERADNFTNTARRIGNNYGAAAVFSQVPDMLPHENGATYLSIPYIMIPRVLYPEKKPINEFARAQWTVALGLQDWESAESTAVSIPAAAEAFWNFGWMGVLLIPFCIGVATARLLVLAPRHEVGRAGLIVGAAFILGQGSDMLFTLLPGFSAVAITLVLVRVFVRHSQRQRTQFASHSTAGRQ